jgi:hypothetical protein
MFNPVLCPANDRNPPAIHRCRRDVNALLFGAE